ncbi:hypothetical protein FB451DRAFT_1437491 [Mycena latifolia]|nr:hypothetical protein FB451DRAFT_1437491 [Mycena latifolia]
MLILPSQINAGVFNASYRIPRSHRTSSSTGGAPRAGLHLQRCAQVLMIYLGFRRAALRRDPPPRRSRAPTIYFDVPRAGLRLLDPAQAPRWGYALNASLSNVFGVPASRVGVETLPPLYTHPTSFEYIFRRPGSSRTPAAPRANFSNIFGVPPSGVASSAAHKFSNIFGFSRAALRRASRERGYTFNTAHKLYLFIWGSGDRARGELNCRVWNASYALPSLETRPTRAAPPPSFSYIFQHPASGDICAPPSDAPANRIRFFGVPRASLTPRHTRPPPPPPINHARNRHSINCLGVPRAYHVRGYTRSMRVTCSTSRRNTAEGARRSDSIFSGPAGGDTRRWSRAERLKRVPCRRRSINSPVAGRDGFICVARRSDMMLDSRRAPPSFPPSAAPPVFVMGFRAPERGKFTNLHPLWSFRVSPMRFLDEYNLQRWASTARGSRAGISAHGFAGILIQLLEHSDGLQPPRFQFTDQVRLGVFKLFPGGRPTFSKLAAGLQRQKSGGGGLTGARGRNSAASHAHGTPRHIVAPSAMSSTAHLEPFLELMSLHIAVIVAGLLCSNREGVDAYRLSLEAMAVIMERYTASSPPHRRRARLAMHACETKAAPTHKDRERAVDASRSPDEKSDSTPRVQERPASPRGGVRVWLAALALASPRRPCVSWPRRLGAPSGGGIRAMCGHASESHACMTRRATRLGHRAPRPLCPGTLNRRVLCALTKLARLVAASGSWPSQKRPHAERAYLFPYLPKPSCVYPLFLPLARY